MTKSKRKFPLGYFDDPGPFWTPEFCDWLKTANSIESQDRGDRGRDRVSERIRFGPA